MNIHFNKIVVQVNWGAVSNLGIAGFHPSINGNLNYQIKRPVGFVLNYGKTLPMELKQREYGKIEEIKNSTNRTILIYTGSNHTVLPYLQASCAQG